MAATFWKARPMRRICLLTTACLLLSALPAEAAQRVVVRGGGFGHGIGLSQYGAYGLAQHGRDHRQIIHHYYRGVEIGHAGSRPVRVLLQASDPFVRFKGATRLTGGGASERLRAGATYVARPTGGGLSVRSAGGGAVGRFARPVRVSAGDNPVRLLGRAINGVSSGAYRGALELRSGSEGGVTAINVLPIDPYVQGVVPGEMPSGWHTQALRAQAVVARTYALATIKRGGVFDLYPDTRSQVYRRVTGEVPSTNAAVRATSGQIVTYGGAPAITYYFSTSGGQTENVENSFLGSTAKPWLKGVSDPYDNISPRHRWRFSFTPSQLGAKLRGYVAGRFEKILVIRRGVSPRIVRARVYGSGGTRVISGPTIRARLGLPDTWAFFTNVSGSRSSFRASRHSEWGVRPLVMKGYFDPAPRGRRLAVERRVRGRWRRVATVLAGRRGRYRVHLARSGVYRVRGGRVGGPPVRLH